MLRLIVLTALCLLLSCAAALAAPDTGGIPDGDFTGKNFGTTAVLHLPQQLNYDPNTSWWGEKLAPELFSNPAYIVGIVNSRRMEQGQPLLDPNDMSLIMANMEEPETGGYRYTVDFVDMRPSEIEALISMLGGPGKVLPGATRVSYEPLPRRYMYYSAQGGAPISFTLAGRRITVNPGTSISEVERQIADAFRAGFGGDVPFDITMTQSRFMDGSINFDLSISADKNYDPSQYQDYGEGSGEGGM